MEFLVQKASGIKSFALFILIFKAKKAKVIQIPRSFMLIVNIVGCNYQFLICVPGLKLTVCFHLSVIFFWETLRYSHQDSKGLTGTASLTCVTRKMLQKSICKSLMGLLLKLRTAKKELGHFSRKKNCPFQHDVTCI